MSILLQITFGRQTPILVILNAVRFIDLFIFVNGHINLEAMQGRQLWKSKIITKSSTQNGVMIHG